MLKARQLKQARLYSSSGTFTSVPFEKRPRKAELQPFSHCYSLELMVLCSTAGLDREIRKKMVENGTSVSFRAGLVFVIFNIWLRVYCMVPKPHTGEELSAPGSAVGS